MPTCLSLFSQDLCMGQFACKGNDENILWIFWGKIDYVIPKFQLTRNQAEFLDWVAAENLSK